MEIHGGLLFKHLLMTALPTGFILSKDSEYLMAVKTDYFTVVLHAKRLHLVAIYDACTYIRFSACLDITLSGARLVF